MNRPLIYLWRTLLWKRAIRIAAELRRPAKLIGFLAPLLAFGFLYYYRDDETFGRLVGRDTVIGCLVVMLAGSVFKGFHQRGIVFEPADVEFLFAGPFGPRQLLLYRLLPNYLYAVFQGLVFLALFGLHLKTPIAATLNLILFQILCFHVALAAAIFAGSISETVHDRVLWMMILAFFVLTSAYLRAAFEITLVPGLVHANDVEVFFFPAVIPADLTVASAVNSIAVPLAHRLIGISPNALLQITGIILFATAAVASLGWVFRFNGNLIETSIAATERIARRRERIRRGQSGAEIGHRHESRTGLLPRWALFRGVGALVWKNLVCARRRRRRLVLAAAGTFVFTLPLFLLLRYNKEMTGKGLGASSDEVLVFHAGVALFLGSLAFLLQPSFPFDFRSDGPNLLSLRTLPVSPLGIALAEIAVPTLLCAVFQAFGIAALIYYGQFDWAMVPVIALLFPTISLGVNAVWNTHYLWSAARQTSSATGAPASTAAGTLLVVAVSFAVFYPAGWAAETLFQRQANPFLALLAFVGIQGLVDVLLVMNLARLFQQFEVSRDP